MENYITKFEKTKIIGQRATQISMGAPPLVDITDIYDPVEIAEKEFKEGRIPFIINRVQPNGIIRHVKVSELKHMD
jgi:DNA-directed RNA polymerases I, II, and III subunit RPABC2